MFASIVKKTAALHGSFFCSFGRNNDVVTNNLEVENTLLSWNIHGQKITILLSHFPRTSGQLPLC